MRSLFALLTVIAIAGLGALASSAVADVISGAQSQTPNAISLSPAARLRAGDIDCRNCDFSGANLSRQCTRNGNFAGANFDRVTAPDSCLASADLTGASFRYADLQGADLTNAVLKNADFTGARLLSVSIEGADLSSAKGLTQSQIDLVCGDAETRLPSGLSVKSCA